MKKTIEERIAALLTEKAEKTENATIALDALVDAMNNGATTDDLKPLKEAMKNTVGELNVCIERLAYNNWANEHGKDAVRVAIRELYIPGVVKAKTKKTKSGKYEGSFVEVDAEISLACMADEIGLEYFHCQEWENKAAAFAALMKNHLCSELKVSGLDKNSISKARAKFNLAANADVGSKNTCVKILQQVVDAIVFIPDKDKKGNDVNKIKMDSRRYQVIRESMTARGSVGCVAVGGTTWVCELIAEAIHCEMTQKGIAVEDME